MGLIKQTFVDQETVITARFLNGLQDQIIIDEETVEDVEKVQRIANAGKIITIGFDGKLSASSGSGLTDRVKSALLGIFRHIAYADDQGQSYYNELYDALTSVELTGVEATFNQETMEVYPSTPLDSLRKNLVVKAVYSNGEKVKTDDYTLSGTLQVGTSTITVTCEDYTNTFNVNVSSVAVTGIDCVFNQETAVIYESDSLTRLKQYLTVKVVYSNGTKEETTNYSLSGTLIAGTSTITATYGAFTDTFSVVVSAITVTSISCVYSQSKTVYDSDSLDVLKDDLVVNAVYSDGSSGTVSASDYTLSGILNVGTSTITVSYGGKTATFNVTVTHQAGTYSITNNLTNCTNSNGASTVVEGENYSGTITANSGYTMTGATVSIMMGGTDITSAAYNNGMISIASVTGNVVIVITASAIEEYITAVFNPGTNVIYAGDTVNSLKPYLVVSYVNQGTSVILNDGDYTLSGTLMGGTNTITVTYNSKTTSFTVENVIDFYNIWEWNSQNTNYSKLTRTPTAAFEKVIDGQKLGISYADVMIQGNSLRGFAVTKGKFKMRNYTDGTEAAYYPIPIPATATKLTATITPSSQKLAVYVFKYNENSRVDGYNYELVAPAQIGYVAGQYVLNFTPDSNLFLTFNCTPDSGNYNTNPEPEMHILFE